MGNGHELAMAVRNAHLSLHRRATAIFARWNVTADQFVLLTLLAERDGVTQQDLVRRSSSDPNTVRAMLMLLERDGLVERRKHATDGRARCVTLTRRGREVHEELAGEVLPFHQSLLGLLSREETQTLTAILGKITQTAGAAERE